MIFCLPEPSYRSDAGPALGGDWHEAAAADHAVPHLNGEGGALDAADEEARVVRVHAGVEEPVLLNKQLRVVKSVARGL